MANRAYLRVWSRDFSMQTMIAEFARFLTTAPLSKGPGRFQQLTVQAVDPTESPVAEWDLKDGVFAPAEVAALAAQHINEDTAYIVEAQWDLWSFDIETMKWTDGPQPLELLCQGPAYDEGIASDTLWPTWVSNISSRDMRDCSLPVQPRTLLRARTIRSSEHSGTGWPEPIT